MSKETRPQKLLITSSTFPLKVGDHIPAFVLNLADGLSEHFETVHCLAPGYPGLPHTEQMKRVTMHRFNYTWPQSCQLLCYGMGMLQNLKKYPFLYLILPQFLFSQIHAIKSLCKLKSIDVVNSHWLVFQGLAAAMARKSCGFRHIVHVHAAGLYILFRLPRFAGRAIANYIIQRTDGVICESNYVKSKLDEMLGYDSKACISCMGVNFAQFEDHDHSTEQNEILFVGRLVEKKGVEYLLKAVPRVQKKIPDIKLTIVGGGFLEDDLNSLTKSLGLECVSFLGSQSHDRIAKLQKTARVIVVPSIIDSNGETEGMPTVLLEAMAAGKRVVASDVNGTPDVVKHNINGWLARPKDPEDLADKLIEALQSKDESITEKALETGRYYDWKNLCERYADMLAPHPAGTNTAN